MSCVINIGQTAPCQLDIVLVDGAPFTSRPLVRDDGSTWDEPPVLTFAGGQEWTATLSGDELSAAFHEDAQTAAEVAAREDVALHSPTSGRVWAVGRVRRVAGVPR